jgi:1,4-alpha-glucan branching enzyme
MGNTGVDFPYFDAYTRLQYRENPFMGPFAKDYFSSFGKSTDFARPFTRDYFFTVNHHWLEVYHVDGFRYDAFRTTETARSGWATRVSSTTPTSSRRRGSPQSSRTGVASTAAPGSRSG